MLISLDWLKEYVEIKEDIKELENALTMIGQEVEAIEVQGASLGNVVIGQIIEYGKHPDAEKLSVLKVNIGEDKPLQIVCGAPNHKQGDKVVVAKIGAVLPGDFKIKKSKIKGLESQGMLCSEVELGVGADADGIIILPEEAPVGVEYRDFIDLNDTIFELEITPNRPDCLSHIGIAREVAAYYSKKVKYPETKVREAIEGIERVLSVNITDKERCKRYCGRYIKDVKIEESPKWLQKRIIAMGAKPINNIVDLSNFVMFEYNYPIHIFDADKIKTEKIEIRSAREGETLVTLDGVERKLSDELLITDGENPIAIAGILGGESTEVDENTKNIFIEVAYFTPDNIRKTSKKLGISTEASYRFERGVDKGSIETVADRAAYLIKEIAGGDVLKGIIDEKVDKIVKREIPLNLEKLNSFVGKTISNEDVAKILRNLNLEVSTTDLSNMIIVPPTYREDLTRTEDLYEEVIRMYGFENIPDVIPVQKISPGKKDEIITLVDGTKSILQKIGLQEVINYSFIPKKGLEIIRYKDPVIDVLNPINEDFITMRPTLMYSLLSNVRDNFNRNQDNLRFFEVSKVFTPAEELANEEYRIAIALSGKKERTLWEPKPESYNFYSIKGYVEKLFFELGIKKYNLLKSEDKNYHPGRSADVYIGKEKLGTFGEIHPDLTENMDIKRDRVLYGEFNLELIKKYVNNKTKYEKLIKYPEVTRDLAVLLDDNILVGNMTKEIEKISDLIEKVSIFDVYKGKNIADGKKSVAISFVMRNKKGTLEEVEITEIIDKVLKLIKDKYNGEIREM